MRQEGSSGQEARQSWCSMMVSGRQADGWRGAFGEICGAGQPNAAVGLEVKVVRCAGGVLNVV